MPRRPRDEEEAIIADEEPIELSDEDRLPWLEAVEEDEDEGGPSLASGSGDRNRPVAIGIVMAALLARKRGVRRQRQRLIAEGGDSSEPAIGRDERRRQGDAAHQASRQPRAAGSRPMRSAKCARPASGLGPANARRSRSAAPAQPPRGVGAARAASYRRFSSETFSRPRNRAWAAFGRFRNLRR